jgi:hypothetical protein
MPGVWLWNITIHLPAACRWASAADIDAAKAEFKRAWEALKTRQLAAAYQAMNVRGDD